MTESPRSKRSFLAFILIPTAVVVLAAFLFPALSAVNPTSNQSRAQLDMSQIVAAVKAFYTEYGHYPQVEEAGVVSGLRGNRELMRCLTGSDTLRNPLRILFFEGRPARKVSRWFKPETYGGGFDSASGDYLDPWGQPYQVLVAVNYNGPITNPYIDDPDKQVRFGVIVWSVGKDGVFGRRADQDTKTRPDDVVSWR